MTMAEKTNALRKLASMKIEFREHHYDGTGAVAGAEVAKALGQDPAHVFKTLVTVGKTGAHYVFMVPVEEELDLKKAAAAVGEKSVEM
ncbi:MAG: Cys-tRNA(Pro) deacylase, partial [Clostridia bacterium]|nr:Cys-tRNA(Pro) deacylase [Clostridia bacterium]